MIAPLIATILVSSPSTGLTGGIFHCVSTHDAYDKPFDTIDYKGIRYGTCCAGCAPQFDRHPDAMIAADKKLGKLFGESLFDMVSGKRITEKESKSHFDYQGIRYLFQSTHDEALFKSSPTKYTQAPKKELLHCPVYDQDIANIADAGGFVDFKGTRYYVCCSDCLAAMHKDVSKYVAKLESKAKTAQPEKNAKPG